MHVKTEGFPVPENHWQSYGPLGTFLHLSGRAAYPPLMQNLCNKTDAELIHSLSPGPLPRVQTLPEDAVHWSQLYKLLEF